ncbi:MAG: hypothetical protein WKG03_03285 [Telluria sp.]
MTRIFNDDYGVYVCHHVFVKEAKTTLVVRDDDGDWQFLCGEGDEDVDCHLVGVGHLLNDDPTLSAMADLEPGSYANRNDINEPWNIGDLADLSAT